MSGLDVRAALLGEPVGFLAGITWLPAETLDALAFGTGATDPAEALATVATALELDFAFVPAHEPWAAQAVRELRGRGDRLDMERGRGSRQGGGSRRVGRDAGHERW